MTEIEYYHHLVYELTHGGPAGISRENATNIVLLAIAHALRCYGINEIAEACDELAQSTYELRKRKG